MKHLLKSTVVVLCCILTLSATGASPIRSARIDNSNSSRLIVEFEQAVTVSNAEGFRLVGGVARIEKLLSGSGSQQLVFQLTDYVLPHDQFSLLYWAGLGDALIANQTVLDIDDINVDNSANQYAGSGTLYYVSSSKGKDTNNGLSEIAPFYSVSRAQSVAKPGDFILLKRGDTWNTHILIDKSGKKGQPITYAAYGNGKKPVVHSRRRGKDEVDGKRYNRATIAIRGADYIHIDNIHCKTDGIEIPRVKQDGFQIGYGAKYAVISNCTAEAVGVHGYFGIRVTVDGFPNTTSPQVLNCEVFNYHANIGTQTYPYDGKHGIEEGGLIENCVSRDPLIPNENAKDVWENIFINRGEFNGFVIRKNKVYGFRSNGIETFGARNIIVEHNRVYNPANYNRGGRGIKAGGASITNSGGRFYSENITIRYNEVYNITQGNTQNLNAIDATAAKSGKIYGNLVYNVKGIGIKIAGELNSQGWEIFNNTVLNCEQDALQLYTEGSNAANVRIKNNILQGKKLDLNCIIKGTSQRAVGANNLLLNGSVGGKYQGQGDIKLVSSPIFVNPSQRNYHLAKGAIAIDAGKSISSYSHDIDGNRIVGRPDIGAYEYIDGQTVPTPAPAPAPAPPAPSPSPSPSPGDDGDQGKINYRYYEGSWSSLPNFDQQKVVKQGTVSNFDLDVRQRNYDFGVVYDGSINITAAGTYTFYTASDDGTKLYIDGKLIVDNDGLHGKQEKSGKITLAKGKHNIELQYFEQSGKEILEVWYAGPGISKKRIPSNVLSPEKDSNPPGNQPIAPEAPPASTEAWLESECANSIGNVWRPISDEKASGGSYLQVKPGNTSPSSAPTGSDDAVVFNFSISQAGQYKIFTRHWAQNEGDDSFWIQINNGNWIAAHVGANRGAFAWAQLKSTTYSLRKGNNQIKVAFREPNARLDKIYVTLTDDTPSDKGGSATNCSASPAPVSPPSAPTNGIVSVNIQDETVTLSQQVTLSGSGDGPNPFRAYRWEKLSGPGVRMEGQNTANAQLYDLQVGTYTFRFTATDSEGNSGSGKMTLSVTNGNNARLAQQQKKTTMTASPSAITIAQEMAVYPNPVRNNKVFIQLPDTVQEAEIQIYGYDGRLLRTVRKMAAQGVIELGKSLLPAEGNTFLLSVKTLHERQIFRIFRD